MENTNLIKISEIDINNYSNIEAKKYLPFAVKKTMVDTMLNTAKTVENNIIKIDYALLQMVKEYILLNNYSNLDLSEEDMLTTYDYLKENKVVDYVIEEIRNNGELDFYNVVLAQEIEQIQKVDNSLESIIAKSLNTLIAKIPDEKGMAKLLKQLPKSLEKVSPETLEILKNLNVKQ